MGIVLRFVCWGAHRTPPPAPRGAQRLIARPPRFGSTKGGRGVRPPPPLGGGGSRPLQPPKMSHTPRAHTLAARGDTPNGRSEFANLPICVPLLMLSRAFERWACPRRHGVRSQFSHKGGRGVRPPPWGGGSRPLQPPKMSHTPRAHTLAARGDTPNGRSEFANLPICVPLLRLSPAFERWACPRRHGVRSQFSHTSAFFDDHAFFSLRALNRWGPHTPLGLCSLFARFSVTFHVLRPP